MERDKLFCPTCDAYTIWDEYDNFIRNKSKSKIAKPNGSQTFYDLLTKAAGIHDKKSHDYANNDQPFANYQFAGRLSKLFQDDTDAGLIGRFGEKLFRLSNLQGKDAKNEAIEDTEIDLLVIIGLFVANRQDRRNAK